MRILRGLGMYVLLLITFFAMAMMGLSKIDGEEAIDKISREVFGELNEEHGIEYYVGEENVEYNEKGLVVEVKDDLVREQYKVVDEKFGYEKNEEIKRIYEDKLDLVEVGSLVFFILAVVTIFITRIYIGWTSQEYEGGYYSG